VSINKWSVWPYNQYARRFTPHSDEIGNSLLWNDKYLNVEYNCITMIIFIAICEEIVMICCAIISENNHWSRDICIFHISMTTCKQKYNICDMHTSTAHTYIKKYALMRTHKQICIDTPKIRENSNVYVSGKINVWVLCI